MKLALTFAVVAVVVTIVTARKHSHHKRNRQSEGVNVVTEVEVNSGDVEISDVADINDVGQITIESGSSEGKAVEEGKGCDCDCHQHGHHGHRHHHKKHHGRKHHHKHRHGRHHHHHTPCPCAQAITTPAGAQETSTLPIKAVDTTARTTLIVEVPSTKASTAEPVTEFVSTTKAEAPTTTEKEVSTTEKHTTTHSTTETTTETEVPTTAQSTTVKVTTETTTQTEVPTTTTEEPTSTEVVVSSTVRPVAAKQEKCGIEDALNTCEPFRLSVANGTGSLGDCRPLGDKFLLGQFEFCFKNFCNKKKDVCDNLQDLIKACNTFSNDNKMAEWVQSLGCTNAPLCPANATFQECARCQSTCLSVDPRNALFCAEACNPGCSCDKGFVHDHTKDQLTCIPVETCDCTDLQGVTHPAGSKWLTDGCSRQNECFKGIYRWRSIDCQTNEQCVKSNGTETCAVAQSVSTVEPTKPTTSPDVSSSTKIVPSSTITVTNEAVVTSPQPSAVSNSSPAPLANTTGEVQSVWQPVIEIQPIWNPYKDEVTPKVDTPTN